MFLGLHFSLISEDDLILVTHDGKVVDGGRNRFLNYAAFAIHSEIHAARPDVICAAHSHSVSGRAFCATGRMLDLITQDSCNFFNDHVLYGYDSTRSHQKLFKSDNTTVPLREWYSNLMKEGTYQKLLEPREPPCLEIMDCSQLGRVLRRQLPCLCYSTSVVKCN